MLKYFVDAEVEAKELTYYLNRIMGKGQYFTKPKAIEIINNTNYRIDKKQRLIKRLSRQEGFKDMTMAEFNEKINQLIDAKDEEEFNKILRSVQKK